MIDFAFLFLVTVSLILPAISQSLLLSRRKKLIARLETEKKSRIIALIHRQETMSILGVPVAHYMTIEDSERILRAIHLTPPDMPIDLIVHTPGGLALAAHQIAQALTRHKAKVTVIVPHYAMSGGTLLALAADEISMDENAVLGPVDPQIGDLPAVGLLKLLHAKPLDKISDQTLILADIAAKSLRQVEELVRKILMDHQPEIKIAPENVPRVTESLVSGVWTHDHPITLEDARALGLPVVSGLPAGIYELMDLYPQSASTVGNVQFIPAPYKLPGPAAGGSAEKS